MNDRQPQTRPIDPTTNLDDLFPSRFLKPDNLLQWKVTEIQVTISRLQLEEVQPRPGQLEMKPVLYFRNKSGAEHPQGYLLSAKVDKDSLKQATGAATAGELAGKKILIRIAEHKRQKVLRIDPQPLNGQAPATEPAPAKTENLIETMQRPTTPPEWHHGQYLGEGEPDF